MYGTIERVPPTGRPAERKLEAVERAMRVLDAFLELPGEVGTNELSRRTQINASTVSRLLATLVAGGYVEYVSETGRYRLGPQLMRLANHALSSVDLRALARPHLAVLEAATGETTTLSIPGEGEAVTVDFVASSAAVASIARVGRPSIAHATATGKVMLAFARGVQAPGALDAYTDRTITEPKALRREIDCRPQAGLGPGRARARGRPERPGRAGVRRQRRPRRGARHPGPRRPVPPAPARSGAFRSAPGV